MGLYNCGRTAKNAYCRIESLWETYTCGDTYGGVRDCANIRLISWKRPNRGDQLIFGTDYPAAAYFVWESSGITKDLFVFNIRNQQKQIAKPTLFLFFSSSSLRTFGPFKKLRGSSVEVGHKRALGSKVEADQSSETLQTMIPF